MEKTTLLDAYLSGPGMLRAAVAGMSREQRGVWLSWGWSYEFPVEIEGSRHYTLEPFSKLDVYEYPGNIFFEGPSRLINDDTGETVGVAVTESMDVRIMQNAPYAANQH
jgi:hypothetical protein